MIIHVANIAAGALLAAPVLKKYGGDAAERVLRAATPHLERIGLAHLALGGIALLDRSNIVGLYIGSLGASYPQALAAILIGALLASNLLERFPSIAPLIRALARHRVLLGGLGIAVGLGSLLFGCPWPLVCGQLFR